MSDGLPDDLSRPVPRGRAERMGQFGRLAGGVAGGMLAEGARRLAGGERPRMRDMLLTPGNVGRVAERLSHLRGAAMKLGQMISMDAGDMLPRELAQIMAQLRENAHHMPPRQLESVLAAEWGRDWRRLFRLFNPRPFAAASIGQVHLAQLRDGRELAIKVQYPGVAASIDADVDNVAMLLRVSRLLPPELDIAPLLAEAKRQLADEADYLREAAYLEQYRETLGNTEAYRVPGLERELTTRSILAMEYLAGRPIEALETAPLEARNRVVASLFDLTLRELFDFGLMQTDPNFANYRLAPDSDQLILLDFGATRVIAPEVASRYRRLLEAGLSEDRAAIREAAVAAGFLSGQAAERHAGRLDAIIGIIVERVGGSGPIDFGDRRFVGAISEHGRAIAEDRAAWHIPPAELLIVQRKISGMALFAARMGARLDARPMVEARLAEYAGGTPRAAPAIIDQRE